MKEYQSRKQFMAAISAVGKNDSWNWSYVNHEEKFVVFGLAPINYGENGRVVLSEDWEFSDKGRAKFGYTQALKHIELVENQGYTLKTFPMILSYPKFSSHEEGPVELESFRSELSDRQIKKVGNDWVVTQTEASAKIAEEIAEGMMGDKLYQQRARAALPILVRQAIARKTINYESLAMELDMPNPQNLNYVLGSIGQSLLNLGEHWNVKGGIPPIQCLAVSKKDGLPGEGIDFYAKDLEHYRTMSRADQRLFVDLELCKIYQFTRWDEVLDFFDLLPCVNLDIRTGKMPRSESKAGLGFGAGGEGRQHKALKEFVSHNPATVGLSKRHPIGEVEYDLPSGDSVDVLFDSKHRLTAVEVKSSVSNELDIRRGLFQCIKYQAVLEAAVKVSQRAYDVETILVLSGKFPNNLLGLKNTLGVKVIDNVQLDSIND